MEEMRNKKGMRNTENKQQNDSSPFVAVTLNINGFTSQSKRDTGKMDQGKKKEMFHPMLTTRDYSSS